MRPDLVLPPKLTAGDRVAVVSMSFAAPGRYPPVQGLLARFPAVLVGLAKAAGIDRHTSDADRDRYRTDQREAILRVLATYNPTAMAVFDLDIGHTDPQWVLPYGGRITVDGPARRITAHY
jgi:hypothetical protein